MIMSLTTVPYFKSLLLVLVAALISVTGGLPLRAAAAPMNTIYVSPAGNDQSNGTRTHPVRTLHAAQRLVRTINQKMTGNIVVMLSAGTYRLSHPLILTQRDSGFNGFNIIYRADAGAKVVISGAVRISGWKLINKAGNLWAAKAPSSLHNTRQLYINGVRALRTRGRVPAHLRTTPDGYVGATSAMDHWRNQNDIEFVYTGGNGIWNQPSEGLGPWTQPRCPVASISGTHIVMAQPCWNNSTRRVKLPAKFHSRRMANLVGPGHVGKAPAYIENVYEFLGTPGQFYFDIPTHTLYYTPRAGEDMRTADVEAPERQKLVTGIGTPEQPVTNIMFSGLQFSYATWLFPSSPEGFSEIQANYMVTGHNGYATQGLCHLVPGGQCPFGDWTQTPGNVSFAYDHHIEFLNDAFVHLGAAGLQLGMGSQFDLVKGCVFTDISANGVELGGVAAPEAPANAQTLNNTIEDNYIYNVATEFNGGVGIDVGYAANSRIEHNQLDDLPYTGISLGWGGWPDKIKLPGVANYSHDNIVAHNLIFNHMLVLADGGGIYTQGLTGPSLRHGEKLIGNVIRNQFSSGHALYTDNGCCNVTAENNVIFHTNFDNWGGRHRDYYDHNHGRIFDGFRFENNYWQQGDPDSSRMNVTLHSNHLITSLAQVPGQIMEAAGLQRAYKNLLTRHFGAPAAPESPTRVAATAGNGFACVSWNPPVFQGSTPITGYAVRASSGKSVTISAAEFRKLGYVKMPGLKDRVHERFTVTATNSDGTSPPSLPSAQIVPHVVRTVLPPPPTVVAVHVQNGIASVHFRSSKSRSGGPVLAYILRVTPGIPDQVITGRTVLVLWGGHTTFRTVGGLKPGRTYHFAMAAVNAFGHGPFSASRSVRVRGQ
jgi:hypothetical protein